VFIVNDHPDIAIAVDADGVHLGQDDLPAEEARKLMGSGRIIGVSTHSIAQARAAESVGADYVGFGPVFPTETKDAGPLQGIGALRQVRSAVTVPIIAIGGIRSGNIGDVLAAGADGAAVISAILGAPDISVASRQLVSCVKDYEVREHTR
jgi:thiamine-phosphate pyrophosphorylase